MSNFIATQICIEEAHSLLKKNYDELKKENTVSDSTKDFIFSYYDENAKVRSVETGELEK